MLSREIEATRGVSVSIVTRHGVTDHARLDFRAVRRGYAVPISFPLPSVMRHTSTYTHNRRKRAVDGLGRPRAHKGILKTPHNQTSQTRS